MQNAGLQYFEARLDSSPMANFLSCRDKNKMARLRLPTHHRQKITQPPTKQQKQNNNSNFTSNSDSSNNNQAYDLAECTAQDQDMWA